MTSVRLGSDLEEALARAAELVGESHSAFIRVAVKERVDRIGGQSAREQLGSFVGVIKTDAGSRARHSGNAFKDLLAAKSRAKSA